jgi:fluoride exporter
MLSAPLAAFLVFTGSGLGGLMRYGVTLTSMRWLGASFPATLAVNALGGLLMGLLAGWLWQRALEEQVLRLFLGVGILGGFTTFSAFSLDAVILFERGDVALAALYVAVSVIMAIGGVASGLALIRIMA